MDFTRHLPRSSTLHATTQSRRLVPIIYAFFAVVACSALVSSGSAQSTARSENGTHVRKTIMKVDAADMRDSNDGSSLFRKITIRPLRWGKNLILTLFRPDTERNHKTGAVS